MLNTPSSYLRQLPPTCRIANWTLNRAVERAMDRTKLRDTYPPPDPRWEEDFADTENRQFPPWPVQEGLAFGDGLLPHLIRGLEKCRRERSLLQGIRSLEHLLTDPELCITALKLNVLKTLTTMLLQNNDNITFWTLAVLRVIAGNPRGRVALTKQPTIMREILSNFNSTDPHSREMAYDLLRTMSDYWLVIDALLKHNCVRLVVNTLFNVTDEQKLEDNQNIVICLLETLANLVDCELGALKAIKYDLLEMNWLLDCGVEEIERKMLLVYLRLARHEIGRLGLNCWEVAQRLLSSFCQSVENEEDPVARASLLAFTTAPSQVRPRYLRLNTIEIIINIFELPNLPDLSRLALLQILANIAELPEGRAALRAHTFSLITVRMCDPRVRHLVDQLINKTILVP